MSLSSEFRKYQQSADTRRGNFSDYINLFEESADKAQNKAEMTKEDLYGDELRSISDKARSASNNTKQALSRALAAGGGDITGEGAVQMNKADSRANEAILRSENVFDDKTRSYQDSQQNQAMNFLSQAMQGEGSLMNLDQNQANAARTLQFQKEQAEKQFWADLLGSVTGAAGKAGAAFV